MKDKKENHKLIILTAKEWDQMIKDTSEGKKLKLPRKARKANNLLNTIFAVSESR